MRGKRFVSLLLAIVLCVGMLPVTASAATSGKCGASATWSFDASTGTLTIGGSGKMYDYDHEWAFDEDVTPWQPYSEQIKTVVIGKGITRIGAEAFSGGYFRSYPYPNLETISFAENSAVTEIGACAFRQADAVKSITLPSKLETLESEALPLNALERISVSAGNSNFYAVEGVLYSGTKLIVCPSHLETVDNSYTILSGTTEIAENAFEGCDQLESITVPGSVKHIPALTFPCYVSSVTLEEGIESIDSSAFWCCQCLESVTIPASVTNFTSENTAELSGGTETFSLYFKGNAPLIDDRFMWPLGFTEKYIIYYPADATGWSAVQQQFQSYVDAGTLEFKTWVPDNQKVTGKIYEVTFDFPDTKTNSYVTMGTKFTFKDEWFFQDSYQYNSDLAKMSMAFVMSGCEAGGTDKVGEENRAYQNVTGLLTSLDFDQETYYQEGYGKQDSDSVAFAVGKKQITNPQDGSETTLLAICLRGSGYGNSGWEGNVEVGDYGKYHDGFKKAADAAYSSIQTYCEEHLEGSYGEVRVWLVGFSRSAAVANLLSQELDTIFRRENIYTYTFATPSTTDYLVAERSEQNNNIFNIIRANDLVPRVPLRSWKMWKEGTTYAIRERSSRSDAGLLWLENVLSEAVPSRTTYSIFFQSALATAMRKGLMSGHIWASITGLTITDYVELFTGILMPTASAGDVENFIHAIVEEDYDEVQHIADKWLKQLMKGSNPLDNKPYIVLLQSIRDLAAGAARELLTSNSSFDNVMVFHSLFGFLGEAKEDGLMQTTLFKHHWPEQYLAQLLYPSYEPMMADASDRNSKALIIACPVDVEIYNAKNELVAKITDDIVQELETESALVCTVMGESDKVILLPDDQKYNVRIVATDDGTMDYTVIESYADGSIARKVEFYDIELTENQVFTGEVNSIPDTAKQNYALVSGNKTINPDYDSNEPDYDSEEPQPDASGSSVVLPAPTYTITVESAVNGMVSASLATASHGTKVTITTAADKGYRLDQLAVTDADGNRVAVRSIGNGQYTFLMPASEVNVQASFVRNSTVQNTFTDVHAEDYFHDAVLWAVENGITSGTSATTFEPNKVCTRAEMVTFLWRAAGKPEPNSRNNPFTDVTENDYFYQAVLWAIENGITTGTSATTFSPNDSCTRAQAATFLYRYAGLPKATGANPFVDVQETDYFYHAVIWAVDEEITKGTSATTFSPDDCCTRAEIVTFLYRYQQN